MYNIVVKVDRVFKASPHVGHDIEVTLYTWSECHQQYDMQRWNSKGGIAMMPTDEAEYLHQS